MKKNIIIINICSLKGDAPASTAMVESYFAQSCLVYARKYHTKNISADEYALAA